MWSGFLDWMAADRIGDLASLAGLPISVIGFAATLVGVLRSKGAAERAERAAREAVIRLRGASGDLGAEQAAAIQTALSNLRRLEDVVESSLATSDKIDAPALNATLSGDIDRLYQVPIGLERARSGG